MVVQLVQVRGIWNSVLIIVIASALPSSSLSYNWHYRVKFPHTAETVREREVVQLVKAMGIWNDITKHQHFHSSCCPRLHLSYHKCYRAVAGRTDVDISCRAGKASLERRATKAPQHKHNQDKNSTVSTFQGLLWSLGCQSLYLNKQQYTQFQ